MHGATGIVEPRNKPFRWKDRTQLGFTARSFNAQRVFLGGVGLRPLRARRFLIAPPRSKLARGVEGFAKQSLGDGDLAAGRSSYSWRE